METCCKENNKKDCCPVTRIMTSMLNEYMHYVHEELEVMQDDEERINLLLKLVADYSLQHIKKFGFDDAEAYYQTMCDASKGG